MTALESVFRKVHRELKPRTPLPLIETRFFPSVGANHTATLDRGVLRVRVSDLFADAPRDVLETVAAILLAKIYRKKIDTRYHQDYRRYTMSEEMVERSRRVRAERGRRPATTGPKGRHYDLEAVFDAINSRFFGGTLRKPTLSWSRHKARTVLGRYDFDQDIIFVSRFLDTGSVPDFVVESILFHEMLHVKHGTEIRGDREFTHTAAFRREEREFPHYHATLQWLDTH